jgi:hypothetical protein
VRFKEAQIKRFTHPGIYIYDKAEMKVPENIQLTRWGVEFAIPMI